MVKRLKKIVKPILIFIILILPLSAFHIIKQNENSWKTAERWSKDGRTAQISVFISDKAEFNIDNVSEFREKLKLKLMENDALSADGNGRVWADCYAAQGRVSVNTGKSETEFNAYGVAGDFFLFHPFELVSGSYFSEGNLMDDLILLDEDCAWQFFGSTDIVGMEVLIDGAAYVVSGVIKRDDGMFQKAAGNDKPTIYLSYASLVKHGDVSAITSYEVVMPNLTKDFARKLVKENIELTDDKVEIIESSSRYSFESMFGVLKNYGRRSMQTKEIIYPYWENVARGKEDICALLFLIFLILCATGIIYIVAKSIRYVMGNREVLRQKMTCFMEWIKNGIGQMKYKFLHKKDEKKDIIIDTVILDIGNVLAEFIPKEFLRNIGIAGDKIEAVCEAVIENEIWMEYDKGILSLSEGLDKFIAQTPEFEQEIRMTFDNLNGIVKRYDYTDRWIQELRVSGYRVLYLSNISEKLFNDCRNELDFVNQMDGGVLSFEVKMIKPDRGIYTFLLDKFDLKPETCVFIDDREANVRAAAEVGFHTILFTSYENAQAELQKL